MAISYKHQITFSAFLAQDILDQTHKLVRLAEQILWEEIYDGLRPYYSAVGRKALPIRLMVGLHLLKHIENMSDAQCADRIRSDFYWMYFCGVDVDSLEGKYSHLNSSSMTKFRNRIGDKGFAVIEKVIQNYLLKKKKIDPKIMSSDSSCMEKNIEYPTDSGLLSKGRENVLKGMNSLKKMGVKAVSGVRSYTRKSKKIVITMMKLGKDRFERIKKGTLELSCQAVHIVGKSKTMVRNAEKFLKTTVLDPVSRIAVQGTVSYLKEQAKLLTQVIHQSRERFKGRHVPGKIYSLHEPQVTSIPKGKRSKPNEYGSKFNISIDRNGFIVNHESYSTNKHDSLLLDPAMKNWEQNTGNLPSQINADRGYVQKAKLMSKRIKNIARLCIPTKGKKKHPAHKESWFRRGQAMRAGIEAVIGHLKQDHRIDKSRYSGFRGDKINLSLGCMAWNLNKLARSAK